MRLRGGAKTKANATNHRASRDGILAMPSRPVDPSRPDSRPRRTDAATRTVDGSVPRGVVRDRVHPRVRTGQATHRIRTLCVTLESRPTVPVCVWRGVSLLWSCLLRLRRVTVYRVVATSFARCGARQRTVSSLSPRRSASH